MENNMKPCQERRHDCPSHLYHYTSLQALTGIIQKRKLLFRGTKKHIQLLLIANGFPFEKIQIRQTNRYPL